VLTFSCSIKFSNSIFFSKLRMVISSGKQNICDEFKLTRSIVTSVVTLLFVGCCDSSKLDFWFEIVWGVTQLSTSYLNWRAVTQFSSSCSTFEKLFNFRAVFQLLSCCSTFEQLFNFRNSQTCYTEFHESLFLCTDYRYYSQGCHLEHFFVRKFRTFFIFVRTLLFYGYSFFKFQLVIGFGNIDKILLHCRNEWQSIVISFGNIEIFIHLCVWSDIAVATTW